MLLSVYKMLRAPKSLPLLPTPMDLAASIGDAGEISGFGSARLDYVSRKWKKDEPRMFLEIFFFFF